MKMNRRNVLVGIGAIVAGGGAALGTGAFSQVTAERDVSVEVANDADAFLAIAVHEDSQTSDFVEENTDERTIVEFDFSGDTTDDGLNDQAVTDFHNLITITNNGSNTVVLNIEARDGDGDPISGLNGAFVAYEGDDPGSEITNEVLQTEDPDDSIDVGFRFDTTEADANDVESIETILITAEEQN